MVNFLDRKYTPNFTEIPLDENASKHIEQKLSFRIVFSKTKFEHKIVIEYVR